MNKKMKKAAAIIAASVLCMGMSMSIFAASVTDPVVPEDNTQTERPEEELPVLWGGYGLDKDGNPMTVSANANAVSEEVQEILKDEQAVVDIIEQAGYEVEEDQEVVILGMTELELLGGNHEVLEVPEGGVDLRLWGDYRDLEDGTVLYVLHQKADGTWEVLEGTYVEDYNVNGTGQYDEYVQVHFDSLSPVAIVKVMSNGEAVVLNEKEEIVGTLDPEEKPDQETPDKENPDKETVDKETPDKETPDQEVPGEETADKEDVNNETEKKETVSGENDKETADKETVSEEKENNGDTDSASVEKTSKEKAFSVVKAVSSVKKSPKTGN